MKEVEYLGFVLSEKGIQPSDNKILAITKYPVPRNVHEVRRFLGLTSYFRRFVAGYALIAKPLSDLTRKGVVFHWGESEQKSFNRLQELLIQKPILQLYDPEAEITELHTDASMMGLAGILLQGKTSGELHPVYYISKKTSEVESKYHSSKLELMAVAWCVSKLRNYLIGVKFILYTDCQAIVYMNVQKSQNCQVARWFYMLQEFDFEIRYRKGQKMEHVDALSRAPVMPASDIQSELNRGFEIMSISVEDEVIVLQNTDDTIKRLKSILNMNPEERSKLQEAEVKGYKLVEGRLVKEVDGENKKYLFVIPKSMRKSIVVRYHDLDGHFGLDRTVKRIQQLYWFPRMRAYVKNHIRICFPCILNKVPAGRRPGELHPIPPPKRPFERVHADHLGPFVKSRRGNSYLLVLVCGLTKFVKLFAVKDTSTKTNLKKFTSCFDSYGLPKVLVTDRGTCFTSNQFAEFCKQQGIHHTLNSSRWPQANGQVERVNRTLISVMASSVEEDDHWDNSLMQVERSINTFYNKTIGKSPFEALHGYLPSFGSDKLANRVLDGQWTPPEHIQAEIREEIKKAQEKYKKRYDERRFTGVSYDIGEVVFMRGAKTVTGEPTKLQPRYKGPYTIVEILPSDTYRIHSLDSNRRGETTAHVSQLKSYKNLPDSEDEAEEEEEDLSSEPGEQFEDEEVSNYGEVKVSSVDKSNAGEENVFRSKRMKKQPVKYKDFDLY